MGDSWASSGRKRHATAPMALRPRCTARLQRSICDRGRTACGVSSRHGRCTTHAIMTDRRTFHVADWMTPCPLTIEASEPLSTARTRMRDNEVRHLPVLRGDRLVGILSQRDLHLLETLGGVDRELVLAVEDAMTPAPFVVERRAKLEDVASVMVEKGYGSAIVVEDARVVGVFTTTDALRALTHGTTLPGR